MVLKLFNTLTRKKEEFIPINKKEIGFYSCGPTVYWFQHIGNLRTYIFNDILKRVLEYNGYKVKHVMNVTDVGHLTSDADEGEDKIEKAATKEGKKAGEITNYYLDVFKEDFKKLNITEPNVWCKATDHIKEQIEVIRKLEKKGFTYKTTDGIYFDTSKLKDYGNLGRLNIGGLEEGKRVNLGEKKNKTDFALWKFSPKDKKRQQEWDSPWGTGFPGWHIECSAMSSKYLGEQFDIHTGGKEHIQIHHTNEIAQSESAFGKKPWVNYWLHAEWLTFKGEKVSKSKGGLFTVSELEKKGFDPLDFRYLCLNTIYKKQLNFSIEVLKGARKSFSRLKTIILELKKQRDSNETKNKYKEQFLEGINDNLNMPSALSVFWAVLRDKNLGSKEKLNFVYDFDKIFGLGLKNLKEQGINIPPDVLLLKEERELARENKNWESSDKLRDKLREKGWEVIDEKESTKLKPILE
jgi:cysteinyl-tRNA synthetase